MFLLEQQHDLNAKLFSIINSLISLFVQDGSLSSQMIVSCGIIFLDYIDPSREVISAWHQLLVFALKSPRTTAINGLFS